MGGSPELAYLTSLRDPSPSSTFQRSSLMGQDPSGCAERSSGRWVCRHLVTEACHPAWRSGIAGERMGRCTVPEIACAGRGQLRPPESSSLSHLASHRCLRCRPQPCTGRASRLGPARPACAGDPWDGEAAPAQPWGWLCPCPGASTAFFSGARHPSVWLQDVSQGCHAAEPSGLQCSLWLAATLRGGVES